MCEGGDLCHQCSISAGISAIIAEGDAVHTGVPYRECDRSDTSSAKDGPIHVSINVGEFPGPPMEVWARLRLQPARQDGVLHGVGQVPILTATPGHFGFNCCQVEVGPPCCPGPRVGAAMLSAVARGAETGYRLPPTHRPPGQEAADTPALWWPSVCRAHPHRRGGHSEHGQLGQRDLGQCCRNTV